MDIKGPLDLATAAIAALLIAFTYAAPGIVAACRRHSAAEKIALLNLLLGWTLLGWVVLLAWALRWRLRRSRLDQWVGRKRQPSGDCAVSSRAPVESVSIMPPS